MITNCRCCTKKWRRFLQKRFSNYMWLQLPECVSLWKHIVYLFQPFLFITAARKKIHALYLCKVWVGSRCNNGFDIKGHKKWCLLWIFQFKAIIKLKKNTFHVSYHDGMLFCVSSVFRKHTVSASSLDSPAPRYSPGMGVSLPGDRHSNRVRVHVWWLFLDMVKIQFSLAEQITFDHTDDINCRWNAWEQQYSVPWGTFWSAVKRVSVTHVYLDFCNLVSQQSGE